MTSAKIQLPAEPTDGESRSLQGPGLLGSCNDAAVSTTLGLGQSFNLTAWMGHYILVSAQVADVFVLFQWDDGGTQPTPAVGNFNEAVTAKDATTPSVIVPQRIIAGTPPVSMVVPFSRSGRVWLAYKSASGTATLTVQRG